MNINSVSDSSKDIISWVVEKEIPLFHTSSRLEENQMSIKIVTDIEKTINSNEYRNKRGQLITIFCIAALSVYSEW